MVIMEEMGKHYCNFMNFLIAPVYNVFFQEKFPRFLPEMKELLQLSHERRVGYWLFFEHNTIIRVYGFSLHSYVLPAFLTLRVFSIELVRQRMIVEDHHLLSYKNTSGIKFPWTVGPLTIMSKESIPSIDSMLREIGFSMEASINYDPHHII